MDYETFKNTGVDVDDVQTALDFEVYEDAMPGRVFVDALYIEKRPGGRWFTHICRDEYEGDLDTVLKPLYVFGIGEGYVDVDLDAMTFNETMRHLEFLKAHGETGSTEAWRVAVEHAQKLNPNPSTPIGWYLQTLGEGRD